MDCPFDCAEFEKYSANLPYPEVAIAAPNQRYAVIVSGAFGGKGSEATAIAQYGIHRFFLQDCPEALNAYKYIAAVEMIHWDLLGGLIRDLGLPPKFFSYETNAWWNGRFPAYAYTFGDIIKADIAGEREAIAHYNRMIGQIENPGIQALFRRIILDEERHIEVLIGLYARCR